MTEFFTHLGLSLAGLAIYSLWQVKDHLTTFKLGLFWKDNKAFWIWAFLLQFIFAALIVWIPESSSAVKTITGIDLSEPMAFLVSGSLLAAAANEASGKDNKIGTKTIKK